MELLRDVENGELRLKIWVTTRNRKETYVLRWYKSGVLQRERVSISKKYVVNIINKSKAEGYK